MSAPSVARLLLELRNALEAAPDFRYYEPLRYDRWWKGPRTEALALLQAYLEGEPAAETDARTAPMPEA
jgi:hypothetical protein